MKNKFFYYSFLFFGCVNAMPLQAGGGHSREQEVIGIIETEIRRTARNPLESIVKQAEIIQTKSHQPLISQQHSTEVTFIAAPSIEEPSTSEESAVKSIKPGNDGRTRVDQTNIWPSSAHGIVFIRFPGVPQGNYQWGSATLIAPNIALTCAHNLYKHATKERAEEVRFFAPINGTTPPSSETRVVDFHIAKDYPVNPNEDYGVLILDTPIGIKSGHFGLSILPENDLQKKILTITGYPTDKVRDKSNVYEMWEMAGPIAAVTPNHIRYKIDTSSGQSGGAAWYKDGEKYYAVGVHIGQNSKLPLKQGTLLTRERYNQIKNWVENAMLTKALKGFFLEDVQIMDLEGHTIGDLGVTKLSKYKLPHLHTLNLANNGISEKGAIILTKIKTLTNLDLQSNEVGDIGAAALEGSINLINLDVRFNNITSEGISKLIFKKRFRSLECFPNAISQEESRVMALFGMFSGTN